METLEQHLEEKFLSKLFYIMKNMEINEKQQYEIVTVFKNKYTEELIDLTDDPEIDLDYAINSINRTFIINSPKETKPISDRTFKQYLEKYRNIMKKQIENFDNFMDYFTDNEYYMDMDIYRDW